MIDPTTGSEQARVARIRSGDGVEPREFWRVLVRRQWAVYTIAGLVFTAAAVRVYTKEPIFRATALVEIERWSPDVLAFRDVVRSDPSWQGHTAFYETQYRILQSRTVARRAAEKLGLPRHPLMGETKPSLLQRGVSALARALPRASAPSPAHADPPTDPMDSSIAVLLRGLRVQPVKESTLVEVSFISADPRLSAQAANAVADSYIEFTLSSQFDTTEQASDFLGHRVGELRDEVSDLEVKLQSYREQREILPSSPTSEDFTMKGVADLSSLYLKARARRIETEAQWKAARESDPSSLAGVVDSPTIQGLQREVNDLDLQRVELLRTFKADWPEVEAVGRKLEQARERLRDDTLAIAHRSLAADEARFRAALDEEQRLGQLLEAQKSSAQVAGRNAIEYATLKAEVERKRAVLNALLQRQNETAVSSQLRDMHTGNARIVDRAFPPLAPFSPRPRLELFLGLMVGLLLGVGAAFGLEAWDNTLRTTEDVERILGLPTLARIPVSGAEAEDSVSRGATGHAARHMTGRELSFPTDLMSHHAPTSPLAEAFRDLRTAISLSSAGNSPRLLAIVSSRPVEGKSTVALNLATVLAQSGRRVLLVDSDLRRPRLHRCLEIRNGVGLSTVLCGKASLEEAVQSTPIPGLSFLPAGPIPPNPSELLDSPAFDAAIRSILEAGFEMALFDSAPLLTVADGAILASRMEGTLMVIESDGTTREDARVALEKIRQVPARILGVVLNNVTEPTGSYSRYKYATPPQAAQQTDDGQTADASGAPQRPRRMAGRLLGRRGR